MVFDPVSLQKLEIAKYNLETPDELLAPYIAYEELLRKARSNRPSSPGNRVTDFSSWIYNLYHPTRRTSLTISRQIEQKIHKEDWIKHVKSRGYRTPSGYSLIFADSLDGTSQVFTSKKLQVNGENLRGIPDLVFKNTLTNSVIIVERKVTGTRKQIPAYGWPNLEAQLWCYSLMDAWADATSILLIGEIWQTNGKIFHRLNHIKPQWLRSNKDQRSNKDMDRRWSKIFEIYGGKFNK